jgi:soluble lytic murein transglycosylase-like protein
MAVRNRRSPRDRRGAYPRHPVGRARRRWPRAFDGGHEPVDRRSRYRAAYESYAQRTRRSGDRSRMRRLRDSPVRNGLIGLAIAGTAAPVAVNRYQEALRTDPAHERASTEMAAIDPMNDREVMEQWATMVAEEEALTARDAVIERKLELYSDYPVTRAMAEDIYDAAAEAGVDPDVAFGLVQAESSFSNGATSHVGAIGLTQLMPRTAAWMEPGTTTRDLRDQQTNLRVGFKYLSYLMDKYKGNENLALLAYNRGPGTVDRVLRQGGNPANGYVEMVRARAR